MHYQRLKNRGDVTLVRPSVAQRFWALTREGPGGCLLWAGHLHRGYGQFGIGKNIVYAHRFAYELDKGTIPDGLHVDHLCRTPACVNSDHLEAVTQAENNRRAAAARRG